MPPGIPGGVAGGTGSWNDEFLVGGVNWDFTIDTVQLDPQVVTTGVPEPGTLAARCRSVGGDRRATSHGALACVGILACVALAALALPATAEETWDGVGWSWRQAFPERELFGAFAPGYAASVAGSGVSSPEWLIQSWHRLPNDLHQWDCGKDSLGQPERCLDETFQGSGEYAGSSVIAHFETISGSWHFVGFDVHPCPPPPRAYGACS